MALKVVRIGTRVRTEIGDIRAIVTSVSIREASIAYELSYFHGGEYKTCWLSRIEFNIEPQAKKPGFVNYDQPTDEEDATSTMYLTEGNAP